MTNLLLREKIVVLLVWLACMASLIDLNTQIGNKIWESYHGSFDRYTINQGSKIGYINARGRLVVKPQFNHGVEHFTQGLVPVAIDKKWGFIDREGKMVIEPKFAWANEFSDGLALVAEPGKFIARRGYIDELGDYVINPRFRDAKRFSEGLAGVMIDEKWGFIDKIGYVAISPQFSEIRSFSGGLAATRVNQKWGFIDTNGKRAIPPEFDEAGDFVGGLASVAVDDKWGYIDKSGNIVIDLQFDNARAFKEGLAPVEKGGIKGYINTDGNTVIENVYFSDIRDFSQGLASVRVGRHFDRKGSDKWGYIDKSGDFVIEPKFDWGWGFNGGLARVGIDKNDTRRGYVNLEGKLIWDPANWARSTYIRQAIFTVLIIMSFIYFLTILRFYKIMQNRTVLLRQQAVRQKGALLKDSLFAKPRLVFAHEDVNFAVHFIEPIMAYQEHEISIEADLLLDQDRRVTFYINLDQDHFKAAGLKSFSFIHTNNEEFDSIVKISRSNDDDFVIVILTDKIQEKFLEPKLINRLLRLTVLKNKFVVRFNGTLETSEGLNWLIDIAVMLYLEAAVLAK